MSDEHSDADAVPLIPLEYYERQVSNWAIAVKWAAWTAFAYAAMTIAAEVPTILFYWLHMSSGRSRTVVVPFQMLMLVLRVVPSAMVLLASSVAVLRGARVGRLMLVWSCVALVICAVIQFALYGMNSGVTDPGIGLLLCASQFFIMLRAAFVPVVLILLLRQRHMREAMNG